MPWHCITGPTGELGPAGVGEKMILVTDGEILGLQVDRVPDLVTVAPGMTDAIFVFGAAAPGDKKHSLPDQAEVVAFGAKPLVGQAKLVKPGANASTETRIYQVRDGSGSFVGGTSGSPCMVLGDNTFLGPHIGRAGQDSFFGVAAPGTLPHASITHKTALDTSLLQALHNRAVFATVKHGLVVLAERLEP